MPDIRFPLLFFQKLVNDGDSFRGEDRFRVKLHAMYIEPLVFHRHDIAGVVHRSDLEISREILFRDNPGVITPHQDLFRQSGKEIVSCNELCRGLYAVKDKGYVHQLRTEHLTDGLVTETDTQDTFGGGILPDKGEQQPRLFRETGTG